MAKGRKTTQEERGKIVAFCIEHGKDYPLTIQTYGVSYQQIYAWVRKYEEKGIDGLRDGRGRTKPADEMSAEERLRMENRILKAQLKDAEMENKLLKKLRELRGGDGQNHAEIDTIPYPQKCRKSAVSGRFFYFRHCGGVGRTAVLPGGFALFNDTL